MENIKMWFNIVHSRKQACDINRCRDWWKRATKT